MYNLQLGIGLYVNLDKTEFMSFKQEKVISTLSGKPLKLVGQFTPNSKNLVTITIKMRILVQAHVCLSYKENKVFRGSGVNTVSGQ